MEKRGELCRIITSYYVGRDVYYNGWNACNNEMLS